MIVKIKNSKTKNQRPKFWLVNGLVDWSSWSEEVHIINAECLYFPLQ